MFLPTQKKNFPHFFLKNDMILNDITGTTRSYFNYDFTLSMINAARLGIKNSKVFCSFQ